MEFFGAGNELMRKKAIKVNFLLKELSCSFVFLFLKANFQLQLRN